MGTIAVLNLAMIALISGRPFFSNASQPVRGITDPILAMEVVRDAHEVDLVLSDAPSPDRETMRIKQYVDFGFILSYAALFVVMAMMFGGGRNRLPYIAATFGVVAAIFDVIENMGILRTVNVDLAHTTQGMIDAIRYPSLIKWACASIALGLLGILMIRVPRAGFRIAGALGILAALLGLYGLADNRFLQWMGAPMLAVFVTLAILFFRPRWNARRRA